MGRKSLYTRKKNIGTIVKKLDAYGNEITTYTSINLVRHTEKHSYRQLMRAINTKSPINNFFYTLGTLYQIKPSTTLTIFKANCNKIPTVQELEMTKVFTE